MPHPESERLRRAVGRCTSQLVRWAGVVYRSVSPRYANSNDLLAGIGSMRTGARWNPPKSFLTVYTSLDAHTAIDEVLAHYRHYGIPIETAMPRVTVAVRIEINTVLDLTDAAIRSVLRVSKRRMLTEPWRAEQAAGQEALTQALGRLAHQSGCEALLVPSAARKGGVNLIVFPDNLAMGSRIEIVNVGELPARP